MATLERPRTCDRKSRIAKSITGIAVAQVETVAVRDSSEDGASIETLVRTPTWVRYIKSKLRERPSKRSLESEPESPISEWTATRQASNATTAATSYSEYQQECLWVKEVPVASKAVYCLPKTNIFVAWPTEIPVPPEAMELFRSKMETMLSADIDQAKKYIEATGKQRRDPNDHIHEPLELRMSGRAVDGPTGTVKLSPTIWVRCSPALYRPMKKAMKESCMKWAHNTEFGEIMVESSSRLLSASAQMPFETPIGPGVTLDGLPGVTLHLEIEDPPKRPHFPRGVLCRATLMLGSSILSQKISRIGGIITAGGKQFGLTTAHGMLGDVWDILWRNCGTGESAVAPLHLLRGSSLRRQPEEDSDSIASDSEDKYACYSQFCLKPETSMHGTNWVEAELGGMANFLGLKALSVDGSGGTLPTIVFLRDGLKSDFALVRPVGSWKWSSSMISATTQLQLCAADPLPAGRVEVHTGQGMSFDGHLLDMAGGLEILGVRLPTRVVQLDQPPETGTSGSWVTRDGAFCGMIIAGYEGEPFAHMLPAWRLMRDIEYSLAAAVTLGNPQAHIDERCSSEGDRLHEDTPAASDACPQNTKPPSPKLPKSSIGALRSALRSFPGGFAVSPRERQYPATRSASFKTEMQRPSDILGFPSNSLSKPPMRRVMSAEGSARYPSSQHEPGVARADTSRIEAHNRERRRMDVTLQEGVTGSLMPGHSISEKGNLELRGIRLGCAVAAIWLTSFALTLEETVLPIIAPTITADFNSIKHLMWYASASYLTSCASQLHWNHVYTSHSPNGSFLVAIILLGAGSIITATASSTGPFIAGRIVTGLAIPGVRGGCTAILAAASLGEKRTKITGAMNIASGLGYLAGSVAAGVVTDQSPGRWRWSYFMLLPLYAFTFVLILASLWGRKRKTQQFATSFMTKVKRLDPLGTILLLVSLYLAVAGIQLGSWVGDSFYILLVASGAFLVLFVFIRRRTHQDPLVPAGVSGRRTMNMAFLFSGCMGGGLVLMLYWISFWVQSVGGPRALRAGLGTLPLAVGMFISSAPLGMVSQRMGDYSSFGMIAAVVLTSVGAGLATINNDSTNIELEKWIGSLLLFGLGIGCGVQMPSIVASTVLDPADVPNAVGLLQAASSLGSGVLFAVGQAVFAKTAQSGIQEENIVAYMWGRAPVGTTPDVKFNGPTEDERRTYEEALKNTVYVIVAVSCVAIVPAVAMAWRRLGGKREALLFPAARGPRPPRNGWYV